MRNILKQFVEIVIKLIVRNEQVMKRKWQNSSPLEVTAMVRMGHWDKRRDIIRDIIDFSRNIHCVIL